MTNRKVIKSGNNISLERAYNIIKKPVVTEKTTTVSQFGQFVFEVVKDTNKIEIKEAIEKIFKVKVSAVNLLNRKGKSKKFRNILGRKNDRKLAYISLVEGYTIDATSKL